MADVGVRPARPDDCGEIGRIQVDTWRTAFERILPSAVLESLSAEGAAQTWSAAVLQPPSPRHRVLVATERQWLVGFAAFGPADPDEPAPGADPEAPEAATIADAQTDALVALLVEPRWGRRGHGSRLLAAVTDHCTQAGTERLTMWIPEGDSVTHGFLESAGWAPDGLVRALDTGAGDLREIRLHTELAG